ncbi:MAG: alpha/beta fold hydrolase [Planctomycetes bacterium]|nr:alpha/beta fold hydrolase [Planctomycetota bacterium]
MTTPRHYAYLHGFASSPTSAKGCALRAAMERHGRELQLPDLNVPSFAELTITDALTALDTLHARVVDERSDRWCLIGSSFGGYLAARWAELHPDQVERLVLLCPGFDLLNRWPTILGADTVERWRDEGAMEFPLADGTTATIGAGFLVDAERHPPFPRLSHPVLLIHGTRDEIVPIETSREVARRGRDVTLIERDDDHALVGDLPALERLVLEFALRP